MLRAWTALKHGPGVGEDCTRLLDRRAQRADRVIQTGMTEPARFEIAELVVRIENGAEGAFNRTFGARLRAEPAGEEGDWKKKGASAMIAAVQGPLRS